MINQPTIVSVVIVNYNGKFLLENCLRSILDSNENNFEIVVVDNGSSDGSREHIDAVFRDVSLPLKWVALDRNYGPSRARNDGVKVTRGEYIAFLDNDTCVHPQWISHALDLFKTDALIGCLQCKLLLMDQKDCFDYAGEFLGSNGFLVQQASYHEVDRGQFDLPVEILAAKSAGMFIRKSVFEEISGFDEDYFIYMEETDLGWRSWMAGYRTLFCPKSVVFHKFSSSSVVLSADRHAYNTRFHGTKNYIMTLLKNLGPLRLLTILPVHVFVWFMFSLFLLVTGKFRSSWHVAKGGGWCAIKIRSILKKRSKIQSHRVLNDNELFIKHSLMRKGALFHKARQYFSFAGGGKAH